MFPNMPLQCVLQLLKCCQQVFFLFRGCSAVVMWGVFWAETERQAEHPVSKLCPANFTGRFNKASGTDRTVKLATVTAISKL